MILKQDQIDKWSNNYKILLNGVDNVIARRSLKPNEFKIVLDGGTNGRLNLFDSFTMKNLSLLKKPPSEIWNTSQNKEDIFHKNLYKRVQKENGCGQLINKSISTPFVGLFGASILISELLRALNIGPSYSSLSIQMRDVSSINAVEYEKYDPKLVGLATR